MSDAYHNVQALSDEELNDVNGGVFLAAPPEVREGIWQRLRNIFRKKSRIVSAAAPAPSVGIRVENLPNTPGTRAVMNDAVSRGDKVIVGDLVSRTGPAPSGAPSDTMRI